VTNQPEGAEPRRSFPAPGQKPGEVEGDGHDRPGWSTEQDRTPPVVIYPDLALDLIPEPVPRTNRQTRPVLFSNN
jgi:hypothetical protein